MRRVLLAGIAVVTLVIAYLLFAPSPIDPRAWEPPPVSPLTGAYAINDRLKATEWWAKQLVGPEAIAFDAEGRLVTGLVDGRIVRLKLGSDVPEVLADTKGRPLGLMYGPDGRLYICDAHKGLLALDANGALETLVTEAGGVKLMFADDLDIDADGIVYFSDASTRFTVEHFTEDLLEHQLTGRLLRYDPKTKQVSTIADGFSFLNGVALGPDQTWVAAAEMGAYRLWKIAVKGPDAGKKEVLTESLPGFPDNVKYAKDRKVFWVAIGSPRNPLVDRLAGSPFLRSLIPKLPKAVQPAPERHGFALAIGEDGRPVESLQHRAPDSYSPVASVIERDGWLYLGSFRLEGVARVKVSP